MTRLGWLLAGMATCLAIACSLNPQPLPPEDLGAADAGNTADSTAGTPADDGGNMDATSSSDAAADGSSDGGDASDGAVGDADSDGG